MYVCMSCHVMSCHVMLCYVCMYVYIYTYIFIHTYIYAYTYIYIHTHIYIYIHINMYRYIRTYVRPPIHPSIHASIIRAHMHACIHTYRHTNIQTYRQTYIHMHVYATFSSFVLFSMFRCFWGPPSQFHRVSCCKCMLAALPWAQFSPCFPLFLQLAEVLLLTCSSFSLAYSWLERSCISFFHLFFPELWTFQRTNDWVELAVISGANWWW